LQLDVNLRLVNIRFSNIQRSEFVSRITIKAYFSLGARHNCESEECCMGHPLLELTGKTAVVIGGTSGIGLALSRGLAEAGAPVSKDS
jgi:hypothetical protein